jgi:dipeptidyl aminopeptidase/acylaminoacyl peptidase
VSRTSVVASFFDTVSRFVLCLAMAPLAAHPQSTAPESRSIHKRPVTVEDAIRMKLPANPGCFPGDDSDGCLAQFSPDGKRFVIVIKQGNVEQNTNEYSLLLYRTTEALHSPKPEILLRMSSSSNRGAIRRVRWLRDNETLVFLGENPGEASQVYALNTQSKQLKKLTSHETSVTNYDIAPDGQEMLFLADTPDKKIKDSEDVRREGQIITNQLLSALLAGNCASSIYCAQQQLFLQRAHELPLNIPMQDLAWERSPVSVSPDGNYGVVGVNVLSQDLPASWVDYNFPENEYLHGFFLNTKGGSPFARYLIVDLKHGTAEPLWDAPMIQFPRLTWAPQGHSFFLKSYLPLSGTDPEERKARQENLFPVEVKLPSREIRKITESELPGDAGNPAPLAVTLEEDLNHPPKVYVSEAKTNQRALLMDLNSQFAELSFGNAEALEWKAADGFNVEGGLYLPPDYTPGMKYPLVIQTHGFDPSRFSMDGLYEWSSGYAARFLASKGIVVLQAYRLKNPADSTAIEADKRLGTNPAQAEKKFAVTAYEGAISALDARGMIDRNRVGIMGFSRTVCFVADALTHSQFHFAAAILVNGIDCGYFGYLAYGGHPDIDNLNGGGTPFGRNLMTWLRDAPGFNLDKVDTPVRLEEHGVNSGLLELWEWYSGLSRLAKPVEYVYLPDAPHLLVKPWERRTSQQGAVDWFSFWLKGEENPGALKRDQYKRWRKLRKESSAGAEGTQ